jgi:hypothetical protein
MTPLRRLLVLAMSTTAVTTCTAGQHDDDTTIYGNLRSAVDGLRGRL